MALQGIAAVAVAVAMGGLVFLHQTPPVLQILGTAGFGGSPAGGAQMDIRPAETVAATALHQPQALQPLWSTHH